MIATLALLLLQPQGSSDVAALLDGVESLPTGGAVPGPVVVFGEEAFAVILDEHGEAVVAAARFGKGRVVALGHGGFLPDPGGGSGWPRFITNAVDWAAGRTGRGARKKRHPPRFERLDARGRVGKAQVLLWPGHDIPREACAKLRKFVEDGGGLIVGACPWGWQQLNPGRKLREDNPVNRVLAPIGLVLGSTYLSTDTYLPDGKRLARAHALDALQELSRTSKTERFRVIERALQSVPAADSLFLPAVEKVLQRHPGFRPPSESEPLTKADPFSRLHVAWWTRLWEDRPPEEITAAPGAELFPGGVAEDAPRLTERMRLDAEQPGWQSTGLYVPAGAPVTLSFPGGKADGWVARIGPHTDSIAHHEKWQRWPSVSRRFPLVGRQTILASPFGGLLYFEATGSASGILRVAIEGVVEAPFFDLQEKGAVEAWPDRRASPAPWAELAGEHLVLTVPSDAIRDLDDPLAVVRFWDRVLASHYKLGQRPLPKRPERFVADVQISAGYMHSGYPIMTWLDVTRPTRSHAMGLVVDVARLEAEGSWGHFHELGHNCQRADWTFGGTGEVTCNLFTLHAMDEVIGIEPWEHPWLEGGKKKADSYKKNGSPFEEWKRSPGLALVLYAELQRAFGWQPFYRVFEEYEGLDSADRPRDDQAKRDQWMVRMSRAVRRDLGPFFASWGIPISEGARAEVDALPVWMPHE